MEIITDEYNIYGIVDNEASKELLKEAGIDKMLGRKTRKKALLDKLNFNNRLAYSEIDKEVEIKSVFVNISYIKRLLDFLDISDLNTLKFSIVKTTINNIEDEILKLEINDYKEKGKLIFYLALMSGLD